MTASLPPGLVEWLRSDQATGTKIEIEAFPVPETPAYLKPAEQPKG
jgi:hypothetical protein